MKACYLNTVDKIESRPLTITDAVCPEPLSDEVLIRVLACGVCRTDLHVVEGDLSPQRLPIIPGHQVVGVIEKVGEDVLDPKIGQTVGVAWLGRTCGRCPQCLRGNENLCGYAEFTGWSRNGGYAEFMTARADFVYPLPNDTDAVHTAPLLCAGIIGYRGLKMTGIQEWPGARIGIYGFGAAGHICLQMARARGADVYVATRDRSRHQALAEELGAVWVGDTLETPPVKLDASIIFAPAGEIVPAALSALEKGGRLVLGGIHMSPIPQLEYGLIYGERSITSVTNNTRNDGMEFLEEVARVGLKASVETFPLEEANDALIALKTDAIKGSAVLRI